MNQEVGAEEKIKELLYEEQMLTRMKLLLPVYGNLEEEKLVDKCVDPLFGFKLIDARKKQRKLTKRNR